MPMTHLRRYRLRVSIPDAVRATILQRMRRMTDFDRAVVMHASVIGRWFDFAVLVETAAGPEDEVRTALERACSLDLVIAEAEPHGAYAFRHALTRDIIYTELLTLAVRPIHGRIARALERAPHRAARLEQLAYHSWAAGDVRRCVKYNELAGDGAAAIQALDDARSYYSRARSLIATESPAAKRLDHKLRVS
jgi:predicted ATPase